MVANDIREALQEALKKLDLFGAEISLEHPADLSHGEWASSVALALAKQAGENPQTFAKKIAEKLGDIEGVETIEIAGPGFINFHIARKAVTQALIKAAQKKETWGRNEMLKDQKIVIEYTDPNPFKEFHIGHLMPNVIGESLSRLLEFSGANVKRANYQGDVGMHVACALWGLQNMGGVVENAKQLGVAYALGAKALKEDDAAKEEIARINKALYERSDETINALYDEGKRVSLEHFEELYNILGTTFDYYFFESETGPIGKLLVEEHIADGVFEQSDGAVVYKGEKKGLHTRVFLNKDGLPTYEAKELGLAQLKAEKFSYDHSIVVTANEIDAYFKVLLAAMSEVLPQLAAKTEHISHGLMRLTSGKMSSRTGNVITGESLIADMQAMVAQKMEGREIPEHERTEIIDAVAVAAIKYQILKQAIGRNIVYDPNSAVSFEGDSGPYLQYAHTRCVSILEKAQHESIVPSFEETASAPSSSREELVLERLVLRFPEIVERATKERAPQQLVTFLTELAGAFNSWYAQEKILDGTDKAPYKLALVMVLAQTLESGLWLLGIKLPKKM